MQFVLTYITFFMFSLTTQKVVIIKGVPGCPPNRICEANGLDDVVADACNLPYLITMLHNNCIEAASVAGWNDHVSYDLVLRSNGSLAPFEPSTNYADHAFCISKGSGCNRSYGNQKSGDERNRDHRRSDDDQRRSDNDCGRSDNNRRGDYQRSDVQQNCPVYVQQSPVWPKPIPCPPAPHPYPPAPNPCPPAPRPCPLAPRPCPPAPCPPRPIPCPPVPHPCPPAPHPCPPEPIPLCPVECSSSYSCSSSRKKCSSSSSCSSSSVCERSSSSCKKKRHRKCPKYVKQKRIYYKGKRHNKCKDWVKCAVDSIKIVKTFIFNERDLCDRRRVKVKEITIKGSHLVKQVELRPIFDGKRLTRDGYPALLRFPIFLLEFRKYIECKYHCKNVCLYLDCHGKLYVRINDTLYLAKFKRNPRMNRKCAFKYIKLCPIRGRKLDCLIQEGLASVLFEKRC